MQVDGVLAGNHVGNGRAGLLASVDVGHGWRLLVCAEIDSRVTDWLGRRRLWAEVVDGSEILGLWPRMSVARLSHGRAMIGGRSCDKTHLVRFFCLIDASLVPEVSTVISQSIGY